MRFAKPQARLTLQVKTQVKRRTQQRWGRAARTRRVRAVALLGKRPASYRPDERYHEPGRYTTHEWGDWQAGTLTLYRQVGNAYLSRYPLHSGHRLAIHGSCHPLKNGDRESCSLVRYACDARQYVRLSQKGFEAYRRVGKLTLSRRRRDRQRPLLYVA